MMVVSHRGITKQLPHYVHSEAEGSEIGTVSERVCVRVCAAVLPSSQSESQWFNKRLNTQQAVFSQYHFALGLVKDSCEWSAAQSDRSQPWLKRPFFIIRLRHIPFSSSVKLRQLDRRASAESENDLITAAISVWIYGIHNACLTRYQRALIKERAPVVLTESQSLVSSKMQLDKALMWGVGKRCCGRRTVLFFLAQAERQQ